MSNIQFVTFNPPKNKNAFLSGIIDYTQRISRSIKVTATTTFTNTGAHITYYPRNIINYSSFEESYGYWHSQGNAKYGEYAEIEFTNQWIKPSAVVIVNSGNFYKLRNWAINISQDGTNYKTINEEKDYTTFTSSYQREIFKVHGYPFKYLRVVQTGPCVSDNGEESNGFRFGKIEVFGTAAICLSDCNSPPIFPLVCTQCKRTKIGITIASISLMLSL